jgi:hypothetical protein
MDLLLQIGFGTEVLFYGYLIRGWRCGTKDGLYSVLLRTNTHRRTLFVKAL